MEERLQKYMARCGVASRRKCEELIAEGQVEVNGAIVREPGVKIDPGRDRVMVGDRRLRVEKPAHYLHYKVKGVTTTVSDDLGRRTVMDCLPRLSERVYPVGRLDRESEGLLILTNDGNLANYLTHPVFGVEKTYRVVAEGRVPEETLSELAANGMRLGPILVKPSRVELVRYDNDSTVVLISVSEGVNREVRRIFAALGHEVKRLLRIQIGPLGLAGMKRGGTRPLSDRELSLLKKGMSGAEAVEQDELFPPGSAASRRPAGPRGRTRGNRTPRRGKPDPAANREFAAGKKDGKIVSGGGKKRGRDRHRGTADAGSVKEAFPGTAKKRPATRGAGRRKPAAQPPRTAGTTEHPLSPAGRPPARRAQAPARVKTRGKTGSGTKASARRDGQKPGTPKPRVKRTR